MDLLFRAEAGIFSYRVAGICVHNGSVLLQTTTGEDRSFAFPGGHVAFGETNEQTLIREFREEIGADIQMIRPINAGLIIRGWYKLHEMELVKQFGLGMFFDIWCAKEAYLKYKGSGFNWFRSNVDVGEEGGIKPQIDGARIEKIHLPLRSYTACICGGEGDVTLLDYRTDKDVPEPVLYYIK